VRTDFDEPLSNTLPIGCNRRREIPVVDQRSGLRDQDQLSGPVDLARRLSSTQRKYGGGLGSFPNNDRIEEWAPINAGGEMLVGPCGLWWQRRRHCWL
jgi:hypothetical protein